MVEFLKHMLDEIEYLVARSENLEFDQFIGDDTLTRAVVRSLEIIGEPSKKMQEGIRAKYPGIEWKQIAGMRDKLIHNYFGVDYEIV